MKIFEYIYPSWRRSAIVFAPHQKNSYKTIIIFLFVTLQLLFLTYAFSKEHVTSPLAHYIHKVYTSNDGLPQNRSRALVQSHEGFLWIGTQDGLARFDGATFQVFDKNNTPALKHSDITSLYETEDSSLWIGTFNGLTQFKKGIFTYHPIHTGPVPRNSIRPRRKYLDRYHEQRYL